MGKLALSNETKRTLLKTIFYGPYTQFTSMKSLFDQVKNEGTTQEEVRK